jgi:hypothetical protein
MRKLVSIFVFSAALFVGVFSIPVYTPTIYEKLYPTLGQDEINLLVGKKVVNKSNIWQPGRKYPLHNEGNLTTEILQSGETGRVVDFQKVMELKDVNLQKIMKNCGLLVKWDGKNKRGQDMFSCHGRFASRAFLEFQ